ncbi:MAG: hypothetical protein AAAB35_19340 [Phyllobacterium sp.]|uniref:hypothetical protein n=1 Tax=Phyllobacterium sp. TaxID=1871046 RepID=UPI0030F2FCE0
MEKFKGKSQLGSLDEALADAIRTAKETMQTDYVEWKLLSVSGADGGYVAVQDLVAEIEITSQIPT